MSAFYYRRRRRHAAMAVRVGALVLLAFLPAPPMSGTGRRNWPPVSPSKPMPRTAFRPPLIGRSLWVLTEAFDGTFVTLHGMRT